MEQVENKEKPILFGPSTGKHLKKMYPELANEPLFKEIKNDDLLFAWYLGNKSSPVDPEWPEELRYKESARQAFTNDVEKRNQYANKNVPESVRLAVEKMGTYSPKARELAARTLQNHFHNMLEMSQVDVKKDFMYVDKDGNELIDWTARNQYISSVKTSTEILPNLIKQVEEGFGIEKTKKEESGTRAIDKFHNDKKNTSK
jgi:hypothetical protein